MLKFIKSWYNSRLEKSRQHYLNRIHAQLNNILTEDNKGIVKHRLVNMPEVIGYTLESGGWQRSHVNLIMSDHFEINTYELFLIDAMKNAANQVYERLIDKHDLLPKGDNEDVST